MLFPMLNVLYFHTKHKRNQDLVLRPTFAFLKKWALNEAAKTKVVFLKKKKKRA